VMLKEWDENNLEWDLVDDTLLSDDRFTDLGGSVAIGWPGWYGYYAFTAYYLDYLMIAAYNTWPGKTTPDTSVPDGFVCASMKPRISLGGSYLALTGGEDSYAYVIDLSDTEAEWQRLYCSTGTVTDVVVYELDLDQWPKYNIGLGLVSDDSPDMNGDITGTITMYEYSKESATHDDGFVYKSTVYGPADAFPNGDQTSGIAACEFVDMKNEYMTCTYADGQNGPALTYHYEDANGDYEADDTGGQSYVLQHVDYPFSGTQDTFAGDVARLHEYTFVADSTALVPGSTTAAGGVYVMRDVYADEATLSVTEYTLTEEEGTLSLSLLTDKSDSSSTLTTPLLDGQLWVEVYDSQGTLSSTVATYTFDETAYTYTFDVTMPVVAGTAEVKVVLAEWSMLDTKLEFDVKIDVLFTSTDISSLTGTSTCGTETLTYSLLGDEGEGDGPVPWTEDLASDMTAVWDDAAETTNTVTYTDGVYSVAVVYPSGAGTYTLSISVMGSVLLGTREVTVAPTFSASLSVVTLLPAQSLYGAATSYQLVPRDECGLQMDETETSVAFALGDAPLSTPTILDTANNWTVSVTSDITSEGLWTFTGYAADGVTEVDSTVLEVAHEYVTEDSVSRGVSKGLSSLTGLPSATDTAFSIVYTVRDLYGEAFLSDVASLLWDGTAITTCTVDTVTGAVTCTGTSDVHPEQLTVEVALPSGEVVVSDDVDTEYGLTSSLSLSVSTPCDTESAEFTLLRDGTPYVTSLLSVLSASWDDSEDLTTVSKGTGDGVYYLAVGAREVGTHTLTVYLDGDVLCSDTVDIAQVAAGTDGGSVVVAEGDDPTVGDTLVVQLLLLDTCGDPMDAVEDIPATLRVRRSTTFEVVETVDFVSTVSDDAAKVHTKESVTSTNYNFYATPSAFTSEGVYSLEVLFGESDVAVLSSSLSVFTGYASVGDVSVGVSGTLSTLSGVPSSGYTVGDPYSLTLVLTDLEGTALSQNLSPTCTMAGYAMDPVYDAATSVYTLSGLVPEVEDAASLDVVCSVDGVEMVRAVCSLDQGGLPFWAYLLIGGVTLCLIGLGVYYLWTHQTKDTCSGMDRHAKVQDSKVDDGLVGVGGTVAVEPVMAVPVMPVQTIPVGFVPIELIQPQVEEAGEEDGLPNPSVPVNPDSESSVGFEGEIDCDFHVVVEDGQGEREGEDEALMPLDCKGISQVNLLTQTAEEGEL
ncbi:hypothetical protein KIPB_004156, partial [Kipferlia bialata]